jgi:hypothetical protein
MTSPPAKGEVKYFGTIGYYPGASLSDVRPLTNLQSRTTEFSPVRLAGTNVPAGTLALVRSLLVLRYSSEQNALHTLIHQRHLTPTCGGHAPTAERTLSPARMFTESLTPGSELENNQDPNRTSVQARECYVISSALRADAV